MDIDDLEEVICGDASMEEKCAQIIEKAIEGGSEDDMTIVLISPTEEM